MKKLAKLKKKMPFKVPKGYEVRQAVSSSYWKMQNKRFEFYLRDKKIRAILNALGILKD